MSAAPRKKRRRKLAAGAAVAIGAALAPDLTAAVITVDSTADTEAVDLQCTLREAITNANDNAATWSDCAAGTGADTITFNLTLPATIVLGGTSLAVTDPLVVDGPGQTDLTIDANLLSRIFTFEDEDSGSAVDMAVDDLTLTNGDASSETVTAGGAIFSAENLTLTNVTISNNAGIAGGGLIHLGGAYPNYSDLTIVDSTFSGNYAVYGGGIFVGNAYVDISGSTLTRNYAFGPGGSIAQYAGYFTLTNSTVSESEALLAGGVTLYYVNEPTITNSTISGNYAAISVGGLYIYGPFGAVTIEDSVISGNYAGGSVGGMHISDAVETPVYIRDTEISGNTAGSVTGGLYFYETGHITLERVRLIDNSAADYQGGAAFWYVSAEIIESQITGNEAGVAGGLYAGYGSYLELVNSTVAENVATTGSVGGIGVNQSYASIDVSTISGNSAPNGAAGNVFLYSSYLYANNAIIANGQALAAPDLATAASSTYLYFTLLEDTSGATYLGSDNLTGVDPQLGPLADNGGPTETMMPALTSPVINAGDPGYTTPANDQRGFPRPVSVVDMGALEMNTGTVGLTSDSYSVNEAAGFITITVQRTGGSDGPATVDYTTSPGSAAAGADYTTTAGTLNWASGDDTSKSFNVPIANDLIFEGDETFNVTLSNATGATLGTSLAQVTINDNDAAPTISIADGGAVEGDAGTTPATFTVTLSNPTTQTVTVDYQTTGGSAASGTDFQPASGTLTFNPLVTSLPINVDVAGDTVDESNETFTVTLSNPNANGAILDGTATGTITDDDDPPTISIDDVTQVELDAGNSAFTFNVTLSAASEQTITVDFTTAGVSATSGVDFLPNSGTVTFNPGDLTMPVVVQVVGDVLDEPNETFTVTLSNPNANGTILDGSGLGTITDDDGAPSLTISDVTLAEGTGGTTNFVFTVTLAPASGQTVTVDYTTQNVTATAGSDYTTTANTLTFIAGDTSETITVPITTDALLEPDETFNVVLSNATNAGIGDDTGLGTILNDDVASADLSVSKTVVGGGPFFAGSNAQFTITVTNAGPSSATNVHVLDTLPAGTTFVSAVPSQGSCSGTITVDCNIGTLLDGGNATITLTVNLTTAGPVSNTATAQSDVTDPTPAAGTANITVLPASTEAIPTLSEWMLLALASAIAAAAALKLKQ